MPKKQNKSSYNQSLIINEDQENTIEFVNFSREYINIIFKPSSYSFCDKEFTSEPLLFLFNDAFHSKSIIKDLFLNIWKSRAGDIEKLFELYKDFIIDEVSYKKNDEEISGLSLKKITDWIVGYKSIANYNPNNILLSLSGKNGVGKTTFLKLLYLSLLHRQLSDKLEFIPIYINFSYFENNFKDDLNRTKWNMQTIYEKCKEDINELYKSFRDELNDKNRKAENINKPFIFIFDGIDDHVFIKDIGTIKTYGDIIDKLICFITKTLSCECHIIIGWNYYKAVIDKNTDAEKIERYVLNDAAIQIKLNTCNDSRQHKDFLIAYNNILPEDKRINDRIETFSNDGEFKCKYLDLFLVSEIVEQKSDLKNDWYVSLLFGKKFKTFFSLGENQEEVEFDKFAEPRSSVRNEDREKNFNNAYKLAHKYRESVVGPKSFTSKEFCTLHWGIVRKHKLFRSILFSCHIDKELQKIIFDSVSKSKQSTTILEKLDKNSLSYKEVNNIKIRLSEQVECLGKAFNREAIELAVKLREKRNNIENMRIYSASLLSLIDDMFFEELINKPNGVFALCVLVRLSLDGDKKLESRFEKIKRFYEIVKKRPCMASKSNGLNAELILKELIVLRELIFTFLHAEDIADKQGYLRRYVLELFFDKEFSKINLIMTLFHYGDIEMDRVFASFSATFSKNEAGQARRFEERIKEIIKKKDDVKDVFYVEIIAFVQLIQNANLTNSSDLYKEIKNYLNALMKSQSAHVNKEVIHLILELMKPFKRESQEPRTYERGSPYVILSQLKRYISNRFPELKLEFDKI